MPYSSGAYGAPQAVIEATGARNALGDLQESWTSVSWERVVAAKPDFIAFLPRSDIGTRLVLPG